MNPIDRIGDPIGGPGRPVEPVGPGPIEPKPRAGEPHSFAATLVSAASDRDLHVSGHALRRLEQRGIGLGDTQLDRLSGAFEQLAGKGGRQSLVMVDQVAFVVHVPSKTVVTAVAPDDKREPNVFTRIDSVVIA